VMGGCMFAPSTYAATYLSNRNLILGFGGYHSIQARADVSQGVSLTAAAPITSEMEQTTVSATQLLGYWPIESAPTGSNGRMNRPEDMLLNATSAYNLEPSWGATKFSWNDRVNGCAWIGDGVKRGVVCMGIYGRGYTEYINGDMSSTTQGHYLAIFDPLDFTPVSGTARYNVQPRQIVNWTFPVIDYTQPGYAGVSGQSITSATSTNGAVQNDWSDALGCITGATITVPSHGAGAAGTTSAAQITGVSQAIYNAMWKFTVIDANTVKICNSSRGGTWDGSSGSGGTFRWSSSVGQIPTPTSAEADRILGLWFESATKQLHVYLAVIKGVNGASSKMYDVVYQGGW